MSLKSARWCGMSLRFQCYSIATLQCVASTGLFIWSLMMLTNPISFIQNFHVIEKDERLRHIYINAVGQNGIEILIGSLTTILASVCLIRGVRKNFSGWILPWLIVTVVDLGATFIVFVSRLVTQKPALTTAKILIAVLYHVVTLYFIFTVSTYFRKLKRQKKLVKNLDLISNCTEATVYVDDETATEGFRRGTSRAYSNPVAMQVELQLQQQQQHPNVDRNKEEQRGSRANQFIEDSL